MGMSASQARLLSITARMNDTEFKSQQLAHSKIRLSDQAEQLSNEYAKSLDKTKFTYTKFDNSGNQVKMDLSSSSLKMLGNEIRLRKREDNSLVDIGGKDGMQFTESELFDMIQSGEYYLETKSEITKEDFNGLSDTERKKYSPEVTDDVLASYSTWSEANSSNNSNIATEADKLEFAKAEAEYNAKSLALKNKEKSIDNEISKLETERNALQTEYDSVKSVVKDNVEKSFNIFS